MKLIVFIACTLFSLSIYAQTTVFYVGTTDYSVQNSIAVCEIDEQEATLTLLKKCNGGQSPGYIALSANNKYLYAVCSKISDSINNYHTVQAYEFVDDDADIQLINEQSSRGVNPCHIMVTADNKYVFAANYTSGNIAAYPLGEGGEILSPTSVIQHSGSGPNKSRQEGPHAHYISASGNGKYVFAADLGIDKVLIYELQANGTLTANSHQEYLKMESGAGPRHLALHQNWPLAFVLNELNSTVAACTYNPTNGTLQIVDTENLLPADFDGFSKAAAVRIHPSGKYLYCSNRGYNSIVVFKISKSGQLKRIQTFTDGMGWLRDFNTTPSGKYLVAGNKNENEIRLLKIDKSGKLSTTGKLLKLPQPTCIVFKH